MIRLTNSSTDLLSLITAQNGAKVVVSYSDATSSAYTGGTDVTSIASATTTTIAATPAASTVRDIDEINIKNTYAGSHTMTVQFSRGGTLYPMFTAALLENESISYTHGSGWCALDTSGNRKEALGGYLQLTGGTVSGATVFSSTITPSQTNGIVGTTTNNDANAGSFGEHISSGVSSATNFPASGAWGDLTSISLTAGDWDVSALLTAFASGATMSGEVRLGISTTSGNSAAGLTLGDNRATNLPPTALADNSLGIPSYRMSLSATTTVYFKYYADYSAGTPKAAGRISARRMR